MAAATPQHDSHRHHRPGCNSVRCDRWADREYAIHNPPACSNARPKACIEEVIRRDHIGEPEARWLRLIPSCESTYQPEEVSGENEGLYQFNRHTWATTPYASHSPLDAYWSTRAAHWGYNHLEKGKGEWSCTSTLGL